MIARRLATLLTALLLALPSLPSVAAPAFPEADLPAARLAGTGTFRWFGLHIYDAQLWVGDKGAVANAPLALVLTYARALDGKKIATSSRDEIARLGLGTAAQQADWLEKMTALFPDVQAGTQITGVLLPATGARFYRDGQPLGEIADPAFARAFFAIWLDPKTSAAKLRADLLANAAPR